MIADISGYTRYLGGVELEHSRDVLADLLGVVAGQLEPPLEIAKLEGDAVFCVGNGDESGEDVVTAIESCYSAFARRRRTISQASSCECDACRRIPDLDLKFLAHHGSFSEHEVAGRRELVGSDVVVAHRLLKNSIVETTGIDAYALLTDSLLGALEIDAQRLGLRSHSERYDDAGEVAGGVLDVGGRWVADEDAAETVVGPNEADFEFSAEVARSQADVWYTATDPRQQLLWRVGIDRYDMDNPSGGRGVGSTAHCVHGKETHSQEIVDWKPPRHFTYKERNPGGDCLWTVLIEPVAEGESPRTRLTWRVKLTGGLAQKALMLVARRRLRQVLTENFESLVSLLG